MRPVDEMFQRYGDFHCDPTNKAIHSVCVPLITWSVVGLLWAASPLATAIVAIACLGFYAWLAPMLALGMAGIIAVMIYGASLLNGALLTTSIAVFVLAWIGQFVGHRFEGRKPAFMEDIRSLLVGPAWILGGLYRRLGIAY